MAGTKRRHEEMEPKTKSVVNVDSPYLSIFEIFRQEIDEHHDARERVLKASKDITAFSKKIIFALQRARDFGRPLSDKRALDDIERLKKQIAESFQSVVLDLQPNKAYRYQRNISSGIQEFMEAVLFQHYLETQQIMTYEEAAKTIPTGIMLTYEDYALGLFDMTGELMKIAITHMATTGRQPRSNTGRSVLTDLQTIRTQLELLDAGGSYALARDFENKLKTTRASVEKVEASVYSMTVRGKERPPGWRPELDSGNREMDTVEGY